MNDGVQQALRSDRTIDITTTGRGTGRARRIEIWFHNIDDGVYITGMPGTRSWYANLLANPAFTFHLKESVRVDLPATAVPVTEDDERRVLLAATTGRLDVVGGIDDWVERSPLVRVDFT
jgi:deazaflavin-dependent oxidoreductase (nitroreductase family)